MAVKESFGIVAAAQRARGWSPLLATAGQRLVLSGLVVHTGPDSVSDPSIGTIENPGQLVEFTGYTPRAIRRILTQLTHLGVIAPLSDRSPGGRNKTTKWTIRPSETRTGESGLLVEKPGPSRQKPGLGSAETRTGSPTLSLLRFLSVIVKEKDTTGARSARASHGVVIARRRHERVRCH